TQKIFIRERVDQNRRTLVWNYLTGFTNGETLNLDFVQNLTGIPLQRPETPKTAHQVQFL
ncbi:MAG TPA: hypothetical protein VK404_10045, partial [Spirosoma sp.]|nr:hypothetical protein [Spirosoma sp.]